MLIHTRIIALYLYGCFPLSCVLSANGRQPEVCSHQVLLGAVELLDAPHRGILKKKRKHKGEKKAKQNTTSVNKSRGKHDTKAAASFFFVTVEYWHRIDIKTTTVSITVPPAGVKP